MLTSSPAHALTAIRAHPLSALRAPGIPILLYHDLEGPGFPAEKESRAGLGTVVAADDFARQMRDLAERGYRTVTLAEYLRTGSGGVELPERSIVLTFDDGHGTNYHLAWPILRQYGFTATFFVVAAWVDTPGYLATKEVRALAAEGAEIGSHGMTHRFLPLLSDEELRWELGESKTRLEAILGRSVDVLAFPGGHFDDRVLAAMHGAGYLGACSCLVGLNGPGTPSSLLRRVEVRRGLSLAAFRGSFAPRALAFHGAVDAVKRALRRAVGLRTYAWLRRKLYWAYVLKR